MSDKKGIKMAEKQKQMKALRVSEEVKALMDEVVKKVAVDSGGEILGINPSLDYVLNKFLKD